MGTINEPVDTEREAYRKAPKIPSPVMFQEWRNLTFLHWRIPVAALGPLIPRPLAVDTFDGSAWVGVTPFHLSGLRPPFSPALPWISAFPETNCRTYVTGPDGRRGVWFFSLDAARLAAVFGARLGYRLPYAWSSMRVEVEDGRVRYESRRRWPDREATTRIEIEPGDPIEAGELEIFLTARFRLYSFLAGRLAFAEVEHEPWPLRTARVICAAQTLTRVAGMPELAGDPVAHFSPGVSVCIGRLRLHAGKCGRV